MVWFQRTKDVRPLQFILHMYYYTEKYSHSYIINANIDTSCLYTYYVIKYLFI
jgi:hypothetical protein